MSTYLETWKTLKNSIISNDILIGVTALLGAFLGGISILFALIIHRNQRKSIKEREFSKVSYNILRFVNTLYLTIISLFPLLGMLGTVFGLLGLDLEKGDMENIKLNFFIALTSTAWGIIFSVIFKFLNAFFSDWIEDMLEFERKTLAEIEQQEVEV